MKSNSEIQDPEIMEPANGIEEIDGDSFGSVDDFLKELEEKEKDLHITSDLEIEIEDSDIDGANVPAFVPKDSNPGASSGNAATSAQNGGMKTGVFEL